jgi:hypothetical protein
LIESFLHPLLFAGANLLGNNLPILNQSRRQRRIAGTQHRILARCCSSATLHGYLNQLLSLIFA